MRNWTRPLVATLLVAVLLAGVSCSSGDDGPTAPPPAPAAAPSALLGPLSPVVSLLTCSPQPYVTVTETIGPKGGTITVGEHQLVIPRGALERKTTITAEQIKGSVNSVRFSPEGLRFERPARLTLSYANCIPLPLPKKVAYTNELLQILEVLRSLDLRKEKKVSSDIDHFSRYAVAY